MDRNCAKVINSKTVVIIIFRYLPTLTSCGSKTFICVCLCVSFCRKRLKLVTTITKLATGQKIKVTTFQLKAIEWQA